MGDLFSQLHREEKLATDHHTFHSHSARSPPCIIERANYNCIIVLVLVLPAGWWFDACGPSNLNGMYFTQGQHIGKLNGIKWHYFKGPSYSLRATAMMIRPLEFS